MRNFLKKIKIKRIISAFILLAAASTVAMFFYPLRSYIVMSIYSRYNYNTSVMRRQEFDLDIKGGLYTSEKDWYPFINTYDTSYEFSEYMGQYLNLTVLYNFGAFKGNSSLLYDDKSEYFAAFYGAYAVSYESDTSKSYGFSDGNVNMKEIAEVPLFDYKYLVIQDLGCKTPVFDITDYETENNISYAGYDGWVKIDAKMTSNSPSHTWREKKLGYIQYGPPVSNGKDDFYEIELYGRMYARYFEEFGCTIVIYVMGADEDMIDQCDSEILSATNIHDKR